MSPEKTAESLVRAGVATVCSGVESGPNDDVVTLEPWGYVARTCEEAIAFCGVAAARLTRLDEQDALRGAGRSLADTLEEVLRAYDVVAKQARGKGIVPDVSGARGILETAREVIK